MNCTRHALTFLCLTLLPLTQYTTAAQIMAEAPPEFSLTLNYGQSVALSYGMNGTSEEVFHDAAENDVVMRYPFGDPDTHPFSIGLRAAYRFAEAPWSLTLGLHRTSFLTEDTLQNRAMMGIWSFVAGAEWTAGRSIRTLNFFTRAGMVGSLIDGDVITQGIFTTDVASSFRLGYEGEMGLRFNLRNSPVSIEASVRYTNVNVLGREFVRPGAHANQFLWKTDLNDAPDPGNPGDPGRRIDYLTVQGGVRVRL